MDERDFDAATRTIGRRGVIVSALGWAGIGAARTAGSARSGPRCAARRGLGEACRRACQCRGDARCGPPRPGAERASCDQHTAKRNVCCIGEAGACRQSCNCCGGLDCVGGQCRSPLGGENECEVALLESGCRVSDGRWVCPEAVDLRDTILSNCDLTNAELTGALLQGADLSHSTMTGANLAGANLTVSKRATNLVGTNLHQAILTNILLIDGILIETNLSEADLTEAAITFSWLFRADLSGAKLIGAALFGSSLALADLTGVIWESTDCPDGSSSNAHGGTCCGHLLPGDVPRAGC